MNREIVESWCETLASDLEVNNASAAEIIGQYDQMAGALKKLNYQILDGFLSSAPIK